MKPPCANVEITAQGGFFMATTKEKVLAVLLNNDQAVSGEWMARKIGITRNSVWKAMVQLREEGY